MLWWLLCCFTNTQSWFYMDATHLIYTEFAARASTPTGFSPPYLGSWGQLALAFWILRWAEFVDLGGPQWRWDLGGGGCGSVGCRSGGHSDFLSQVWREVIFITAVTKSTWSSAHYNNKQVVGRGRRVERSGTVRVGGRGPPNRCLPEVPLTGSNTLTFLPNYMWAGFPMTRQGIKTKWFSWKDMHVILFYPFVSV